MYKLVVILSVYSRLVRAVFILILFFLNFVTLDFINAQTNTTMILENEALNENSQDRPKVEVSIEGTPNDDKIRGGDGNDEINGAAGNDIIYGKEGDDEFQGGTGDDILNGEDGDDTLHGGKGDDKLVGGIGSDELEGGSGADLFVCDEDDKVIDFNSLENDRSDGPCEIIDEPLSSGNNENDDDNNDDFNEGDLEDDDDDLSSLGPIF
ncbi:MAG TPA: calcium-binding protein [Nitrososphaeraceae archaeon]